MTGSRLPFNVTNLDVVVEEGVKLNWQGKEIDSGPLTIKLGEPGSGGVIDYEAGTVNVEFRVDVSFPEFAEILEGLGMEPALTAPIRAVIRSQGSVFDDHSLRLAGKGEVAKHRLFDWTQTRINIRAPSQ